MNIPDNIAWLEDLAVNSLEHGHADQASRLWAISKWIGEATKQMIKQDALSHTIKHELDKAITEVDRLSAYCEELQNKLTRFGA